MAMYQLWGNAKGLIKLEGLGKWHLLQFCLSVIGLIRKFGGFLRCFIGIL
jgi:hypothetical protein